MLPAFGERGVIAGLDPATHLLRKGSFDGAGCSECAKVAMKLIYFAWVRERIGKPAEEVELPAGIATVADLIAWLTQRGDAYAHAFENPKVIRAAIDRAHVKPDAAIAGAREIAFFPPMTGG
jgi:molybdopterin synthase sulfur carrier subunit